MIILTILFWPNFNFNYSSLLLSANLKAINHISIGAMLNLKNPFLTHISLRGDKII